MNKTNVLQDLTEAAERFVNKAPKQARLEAERTALLAAITRAQLILSVSNTNGEQREDDSSTEEDRTEAAALLRSFPGSEVMSKRQKQIVRQKSRSRRK
jgi:hypothetical protein